VSPDFWMNLQKLYDLDVARQVIGDQLDHIPRRSCGLKRTPEPLPS
jgi:plasmid maintenance system antidote protein VapI